MLGQDQKQNVCDFSAHVPFSDKAAKGQTDRQLVMLQEHCELILKCCVDLSAIKCRCDVSRRK